MKSQQLSPPLLITKSYKSPFEWYPEEISVPHCSPVSSRRSSFTSLNSSELFISDDAPSHFPHKVNGSSNSRCMTVRIPTERSRPNEASFGCNESLSSVASTTKSFSNKQTLSPSRANVVDLKQLKVTCDAFQNIKLDSPQSFEEDPVQTHLTVSSIPKSPTELCIRPQSVMSIDSKDTQQSSENPRASYVRAAIYGTNRAYQHFPAQQMLLQQKPPVVKKAIVQRPFTAPASSKKRVPAKRVPKEKPKRVQSSRIKYSKPLYSRQKQSSQSDSDTSSDSSVEVVKKRRPISVNTLTVTPRVIKQPLMCIGKQFGEPLEVDASPETKEIAIIHSHLLKNNVNVSVHTLNRALCPPKESSFAECFSLPNSHRQWPKK